MEAEILATTLSGRLGQRMLARRTGGGHRDCRSIKPRQVIPGTALPSNRLAAGCLKDVTHASNESGALLIGSHQQPFR